jgi:hypothetical protein
MKALRLVMASTSTAQAHASRRARSRRAGTVSMRRMLTGPPAISLFQIKAPSGRPANHAATIPTSRGGAMTHDSEDDRIPWMQQLLDNPFLLLFLGVLIPMLVYTLWGVVDILTIPVGK